MSKKSLKSKGQRVSEGVSNNVTAAIAPEIPVLRNLQIVSNNTTCYLLEARPISNMYPITDIRLSPVIVD